MRREVRDHEVQSVRVRPDDLLETVIAVVEQILHDAPCMVQHRREAMRWLTHPRARVLHLGASKRGNQEGVRGLRALNRRAIADGRVLIRIDRGENVPHLEPHAGSLIRVLCEFPAEGQAITFDHFVPLVKSRGAAGSEKLTDVRLEVRLLIVVRIPLRAELEHHFDGRLGVAGFADGGCVSAEPARIEWQHFGGSAVDWTEDERLAVGIRIEVPSAREAVVIDVHCLASAQLKTAADLRLDVVGQIDVLEGLVVVDLRRGRCRAGERDGDEGIGEAHQMTQIAPSSQRNTGEAEQTRRGPRRRERAIPPPPAVCRKMMMGSALHFVVFVVLNVLSVLSFFLIANHLYTRSAAHCGGLMAKRVQNNRKMIGSRKSVLKNWHETARHETARDDLFRPNMT